MCSWHNMSSGLTLPLLTSLLGNALQCVTLPHCVRADVDIEGGGGCRGRCKGKLPRLCPMYNCPPLCA